MALTPLDIKNKVFSTKMRGYNNNEVDDFLDQVIVDFEESLRERKELEKALKIANEKLTYFNELKDALNQSIVVAQDTAEKLKESAEKESEVTLTSANADAETILRSAKEEAEMMLSEANRHANEIVDAATLRANTLASETDDLKSKTKEFHRNISLILESQLEVVKSKDWDNLLSPFSNFIEDKHQAVKEVLNQNPSIVEIDEPTVTEQEVEVIEPKELSKKENNIATPATNVATTEDLSETKEMTIVEDAKAPEEVKEAVVEAKKTLSAREEALKLSKEKRQNK